MMDTVNARKYNGVKKFNFKLGELSITMALGAPVSVDKIQLAHNIVVTQQMIDDAYDAIEAQCASNELTYLTIGNIGNVFVVIDTNNPKLHVDDTAAY